MKLIDAIIKLFNNQYYIGPVLLTSIMLFLFLSPYSSSGGFDLVVTFYTFVVIISAALMLLFAHHIIKGNKELTYLFNLSLLCIITSILSVMFSKSISFVNHFAVVMFIISMLLFFVILKELASKLESK